MHRPHLLQAKHFLLQPLGMDEVVEVFDEAFRITEQQPTLRSNLPRKVDKKAANIHANIHTESGLGSFRRSWAERWRRREAQGDMIVVRYAGIWQKQASGLLRKR